MQRDSESKALNLNKGGRDATIDFLRGMAALMVVAVHVFGNSQVCEMYVHQIAQFGQLGVQLFFVLSAYTLSNSLDKGAFALNFSHYTSFIIKRYFRIAPLFYFGLLLYFLVRLYFKDPMQYTVLTITSNLLLLHGVYLTPAASNAVPGGWSVGAEFLFYLIFPLIFVWAKGSLKRLFLLGIFSVIASIGTALLALMLSGKPLVVTNNGQIYMAITSQFPCFIAGMFAYYLMKHSTGSSKKQAYIYLLTSAAFALCVISIWMGNYLEPIKFLLVSIISGVSFLFLLCGLLTLGLSWSAIFSLIGERSYSIYIVHFVFVYFFARNISSQLHDLGLSGNFATLVSYVLIAITAFLTAGFTYKWIEQPFIRRGSEYAKRFK